MKKYIFMDLAFKLFTENSFVLNLKIEVTIPIINPELVCKGISKMH